MLGSNGGTGLSTLSSLLEREGRERGLLDSGELLTAERAFALVRDMPYRRASSRRPEAIVGEWRGTCSGKHYLLADIFREMEMDLRVMMCTHRFTAKNTAHFPAGLRKLVAGDAVPDVHTFLWVDTERGWTLVDATWPSSAGPLGMTVNRDFRPGENMTLACDPLETYEVPAGQDPQEFKEQLIREFCGDSSAIRDEFIEGMGHWLGEST